MHEVLVNRLGGLSLPRKSVVRLTDRPDMTLDVYRGRKTTIQQQRRCRCKCERTDTPLSRIVIFSTKCMPYTFLGAPVSQKVMRWPTDQQSRARALLEAEMFLIVNMKV